MFFKLLHTSLKSNARIGKIQTDRGIINTPVFMPVGTLGTVKGINQRELINDINAEIILSNTYHLYLRPGNKIIKGAGGLHDFINWKKPILTDSGGYQIFSLSANRKIKEKGVYFNSHIDGSKHFFSPESVIDVQNIIGSDIAMVLDECIPYPSDYSYAKKSLDITHNWLDRSIKRHALYKKVYNKNQFLFPIVQGGVFEDLRKKSLIKTV